MKTQSGSLPVRQPTPASLTVAKKQAIEALALAQFGLERASAAVEEAMRRLKEADELPSPPPLPPLSDRPRVVADPDQLLRLSELKRLVGLSHTAIYRKMRQGAFPSSVSIGPNSVRWRRRDVEAWLAWPRSYSVEVPVA